MSRDARLTRLLQQLESTRFRDLAGARVSATIPISERLLNEIVATFTPQSAPVHDIAIRPLAGNRFGVRLKLAKSFVPPLSLEVQIVGQPVLPDRPVAEFRIEMPPALMIFAGAAMAMAFTNSLPPGVRMEGDRLFVDLRTLARARGFSQLLDYAERIELTTEEGQLIVKADLRV